MTAAERQQRKRDRQKAGLVRVEVWVPADKAQAVRDAVAEVLAEPQDRWIAMDYVGPSVCIPATGDAKPGPAQTWRAVSEEDYQLLQRLRK